MLGYPLERIADDGRGGQVILAVGFLPVPGRVHRPGEGAQQYPRLGVDRRRLLE